MKRCIEEVPLIFKLSEGACSYGNGDNYDWNIIVDRTIEFLK